MNHDLERIWKWLWPDLRYCLPRTEKNEKTGRVGTVCVTCESPPEYKSEVLLLEC